MSKKEAFDLIKSLNNTEINDNLFKVDRVETSEEKAARMEEIKLYTEWKNQREENNKLLKLVK